MAEATVILEVHEGVATVRINRPDKLNALNASVRKELRDAFERIAADPSIGAVIVTGTGEKAFVAGADIEELSRLDEGSGRRFSDEGQALFNLIESLDRPVIAAVNGYALGGGCELALACHMRIASASAKFGQPEVNLGTIPGYGGTQRLTRLVGKGKALEMILTGEAIDAQEAHRIGLANTVVPPAELMATAERVARMIMTKGPKAVANALRAVRDADERHLSGGQEAEAALFGQCCGSDEFHEGTAAFLQKRKPQFRNA